MILPPKAAIERHSNFYHQKEFIDNFHWIRNIKDPRVLEYISSENTYANQILGDIDPQLNILYQEFKTRTKEDDESVPEKVDNYYYYERNEKGKEYEILCRKKDSLANSPEEIYLDLNKRSEKYIDLGDSDVSPDHSAVVYSLDFVGNENYHLFIKNLFNHQIKELSRDNLGGFVCFANDSKGIFFDELNELNIPSKICFAPDIFNTDTIIELFEEKDATKALYFYKTKDKNYFIASSDDKDSSEVYFLDLTQPIDSTSLNLFAKRKENVIYQVYHNQNYFYILTNENDSINFKIMRVKDEYYEQRDKWETFLEHSNIQLEYLEMFENFIVVHVRIDGIRNIIFYDIKNNNWHEIENLPEKLHTINSHEAPDNNEYYTTKLRFNYSSMVTPMTVYDYDMENNQLETLKVQEVKNYTKDDYLSKRIFVTAKDGTRIPVSLFFKKSLNLDGKNPLILYGYGAYGLSIEPGFLPYALSLVERGFIYAIAHVRGGGEYGRSWYEAGKYDKKMNTFTDFISCLRYLIDHNYTSSDKVAIRGGSAGGLLVGAVVNMAPELIKTAVLSAPFVDVLNTMNDATIPLTTLEFYEYGNPIDSYKIFERILEFSPYDNLKKLEKCSYPNILVLTSLNDSRVPYWEPVKYVAKLRSVKQDSNLLVLKTTLDTGHSGASGKYEYLKELSLEYTFILTTLVNNNSIS